MDCVGMEGAVRFYIQDCLIVTELAGLGRVVAREGGREGDHSWLSRREKLKTTSREGKQKIALTGHRTPPLGIWVRPT